MGSTTNCKCKCSNSSNDTEMDLPEKRQDDLQIIDPEQLKDNNYQDSQKQDSNPNSNNNNNNIKSIKDQQPISLISNEVRFQRVYPSILKKSAITKEKDIIQESQEYQENSIDKGIIENKDNNINSKSNKNIAINFGNNIENSFDKMDFNNIDQVDPIAHISQSNKEILNTSTEGFNKNIIQEIDKKEMKSLKQNLAVVSEKSSKQVSSQKFNTANPEENILSLKEFASLRHSKDVGNATDYFVDNKLTLKKIKGVKDININSIIPSITLRNNLNDDALFYSELKKLQYGDGTSKNKIKHTSKFCVVTRKDFRSYVSKEKFIMLQKPISYNLLKEIKGVTLVNIEGEFKGICNGNGSGCAFNFMISYNRKDAYEVYGSSNEDIVNKWVIVLNYVISEIKKGVLQD